MDVSMVKLKKEEKKKEKNYTLQSYMCKSEIAEQCLPNCA